MTPLGSGDGQRSRRLRVGVSVRATSRRDTDGSVVRDVQLAHDRRVEGVRHARVLLDLGREDRLDPDGLRRLVASINRYLGEPAGGDDVREAVGTPHGG